MDFSKLSMKKIRELIIFTALLAAALWKFEVVIDVLKTIWGIIFPFALGGAIAFVINVPMSFLEKMIFGKIKILQNDLDEWLREYNESHPRSWKYYYGKKCRCKHSWRLVICKRENAAV